MVHGMLGAVTLAVAASGAFASKTVQDVIDNLPSGGGSGSTSSSGSTTVSASIQCDAKGWSDAFSSYEDIYIDYTKKLIRNACTFQGKKKVKRAADEIGGVWAHATAEASAYCKAKTKGGGKASGCAVANAVAEAWNVAFVDVHVSAVAEALDGGCGCANAWAFGTAEFYLDLVAEAYAYAEAAACAVDNEESSAEAIVDCWADVIAQVWTKAWAKVVIDGDCSPAHVRAWIKAEADAEITYSDGCNIHESSSGTAGANGDGSSGTRVRDRH